MEYTTKDSGQRVEFNSGFKRDVNTGKPRYELIPHELLTRLAELYARGAEKYGVDNWRKATEPEAIERFKESGFRHFVQWLRGDEDEDHATATIWNIISYEWHTKHNVQLTSKEIEDKVQITTYGAEATGAYPKCSCPSCVGLREKVSKL